ncbi:hypothetical protein J8J14_14730 [Roseomonas sp. SSH11]|uniref:Uncharacterized protein n=1 Tax=Pararoseomonas baculiformis TaxID=2820812 RepID=A0ABS4AG98_9PROT|nr:hypothetical protein [Pararoseomonas baculiformis]MBP0446030.1 hypothetical protein [Pararoseomonas baculiformis]
MTPRPTRILLGGMLLLGACSASPPVGLPSTPEEMVAAHPEAVQEVSALSCEAILAQFGDPERMARERAEVAAAMRQAEPPPGLVAVEAMSVAQLGLSMLPLPPMVSLPVNLAMGAAQSLAASTVGPQENAATRLIERYAARHAAMAQRFGAGDCARQLTEAPAGIPATPL